MGSCEAELHFTTISLFPNTLGADLGFALKSILFNHPPLLFHIFFIYIIYIYLLKRKRQEVYSGRKKSTTHPFCRLFTLPSSFICHPLFFNFPHLNRSNSVYCLGPEKQAAFRYSLQLSPNSQSRLEPALQGTSFSVFLVQQQINKPKERVSSIEVTILSCRDRTIRQVSSTYQTQSQTISKQCLSTPGGSMDTSWQPPFLSWIHFTSPYSTLQFPMKQNIYLDLLALANHVVEASDL